MDWSLLTQNLKPLAMSLVQAPMVFMALAIAGGWQLQKGRRRRGWLLLLTTVVAVWLSGCEGFGRFLSQQWLNTPPALDRGEIARLRTLQAKDGGVAVLVLGGGARQWAPEYQGPSLNEYSQPRLRLGIWLSRQIQAPLGFSGGIGWQARDQLLSEGQIARRVAADEFQHPLAWIEDRSRDTRENARFSLDYLQQRQIRTLVLVTHEQHLPRALRAFREAMADRGVPGAIALIPAPAGLRPDGPWRLSTWLPSTEGYARVRYVIYEALALATGH